MLLAVSVAAVTALVIGVLGMLVLKNYDGGSVAGPGPAVTLASGFGDSPPQTDWLPATTPPDAYWLPVPPGRVQPCNPRACGDRFAPVCADNHTFVNECVARCAGGIVTHAGMCAQPDVAGPPAWAKSGRGTWHVYIDGETYYMVDQDGRGDTRSACETDSGLCFE